MNKASRPISQGFGILLVYFSFLALNSTSCHILHTQDFLTDEDDLERNRLQHEYSSKLKNSIAHDSQDDNNDDVLLVPVTKGITK